MGRTTMKSIAYSLRFRWRAWSVGSARIRFRLTAPRLALVASLEPEGVHGTFEDAPGEDPTVRGALGRFLNRLAAALVLSLVVVLTGTVIPAQATASGENGRIAFRRYLNAAQTHGAIFTVQPDGTGLLKVTHPPRGVLHNEPDWSPSGRWLAYMISRGGEGSSRIYKIRPNGTARTSLGGSCTSPCLFDGFPAWSPQGRRISFERALGPSGGQENLRAIFVMRADGTHARRVTQFGADPAVPHPNIDKAPAWSPGATRLAFERHNDKTQHHAIFTVRLDGTGLRRITRWRLDAAQPDYSPNGRWILFRSQANSDTEGNLWLVHPDGTGLHRVTHAFGGSGKWLSGSFSPNGQRITAGKFPGDTNADVYRMRLDGSHVRNVTNSSPWESAPDWGPRVAN